MPSESTDPRIDRTRRHVLACALTMLTEDGAEAVTFSTVAREARVSRATLYRHWTSREQLLADVIAQAHSDPIPVPDPPDPASYLRAFLHGIRAGLCDPATQSALSALMAHATRDDGSRATLHAMGAMRRADLERGWGPVTPAEYDRIVGPIFIRVFLTHQPVTEGFVEELVADAMRRRDDRS